MSTRPGPFELWPRAGGGTSSYSRERYHELMLEHGLLIPLKPGEKREPLPCGWPDRRVADAETAHGEALLDEVYRDWPGEPGDQW